MSNNPLVNELKQKMDKCLKALQGELTKVRTGRASIALLDDVS